MPREEEAKQILSEIRCKGYTKSLMRKAGQYCVNVYEKNFKMLYDARDASGNIGGYQGFV